MPALAYELTGRPLPIVEFTVPWMTSHRVRQLCEETLGSGSGRDDSVGNAAPSLKIARYGMYRFRVAITEGEREISVDVLQPDAAAERPFLRVKANADIGITSDVTTEALSGTAWQTLICAVSPTANGGVWVELWNADPGLPCWWDNLGVQAV